MMREEIAGLISSCTRQPPPDAVTDNVGLAACQVVRLYYKLCSWGWLVAPVRTVDFGTG